MSTLKIREYSKVGTAKIAGKTFSPSRGEIAFEDGNVVDQTPVSFTSSSVQSAAFNAATRYIVAKADVAWCYSIGSNPTATVNMIDVAADQLLYLAVTPGHKIAVIAAA